MLRLLHTADWQLGMRFEWACREEGLREWLQNCRLETARRLAERARDEEVDLVLIAGDLFDVEDPSPRLLHEACDVLSAFDRPVLVIPGNHDPHFGAGSLWERLADLRRAPPGLQLLLEREAREVELPGGRSVQVLPAPRWAHDEIEESTAWMEGAPARPPGAFRIGLAHGGTEDFGTSGGATIPADRARRSDLDYLALGDWHGTRKVGPRAWQAGTPEPTSFKDNASGHCLVVEISEPGAQPEVRPLRVASARWRREEAVLEGADDVTTLRDRLLRDGERSRTLLRLEVRGTLDAAGAALWEEARAELIPAHRHVRLRDDELTRLADEELTLRLPPAGWLQAAAEALLDRAREGEPGNRARARLALRKLAGFAEEASRSGGRA